MTNLNPGDVVLIRIDFRNAAGNKIRPAIVVLDTGDDDFVAAPVTSRARQADFDFALTEWRAAGLNVSSVVRLHKVAVLSKTDILRTLGRCSELDRGGLFQMLCHAYCNAQ